MNDRSISANAVASATLWVIGAFIVFCDLINLLGDRRNGAAELGLLLAGAGGVLSIRGFFCRQAAREKAAFDLGCEVGRSGASEPNLRKV